MLAVARSVPDGALPTAQHSERLAPQRAGWPAAERDPHPAKTQKCWVREPRDRQGELLSSLRPLTASGSHPPGDYCAQWHLGYACWEYTPTFRGYSSYYGFYSGGQDYFMHGSKGSLDFHLEVGERCGDNCSLPQWNAVGTYSTTLFTSRAVEVVEQHDTSSPLFVYLAYQAVHAPREVPALYADKYNDTIQDNDRRQFAGMLTCMDEGIGNFTAALSDNNMLDNTFIIFSTDNGGPVPDTPGGDYVGSRNYPLRGGKHSTYTAQDFRENAQRTEVVAVQSRHSTCVYTCVASSRYLGGRHTGDCAYLVRLSHGPHPAEVYRRAG
jgi:hypothetical protein